MASDEIEGGNAKANANHSAVVNLNHMLPCGQNHGQNAKGNANHSVLVIKNTMGLDAAFMVTFQRDSSAIS